MKHYGQYCPMARTSELFAERWTPIIVRNLLGGCRTFGELRAGAPGISKALLAQRLDALAKAGVVTAERAASGRGRTYALTPKGRELKAITDAMGAWGARWLELEGRDIDAQYVLWATCRLVEPERIPAAGMVIRVDLADRPAEPYWLVLRQPQAEVCSTYPGVAEDLILATDSETLARWHLRHLSYDAAVQAGRIRIEGAASLRAAFLACVRPSPFAHIALDASVIGAGRARDA